LDKGAGNLPAWAGRMTVALVSLACVIQMILTAYPSPRYYFMQTYNQQHSINQRWSGEPLIEAVSALPELLFGADQSTDPAHQYLLTLPNPVNQIRADLWLLKAPLLGVPRSVAYSLTILLLTLFVFGMRAVLWCRSGQAGVGTGPCDNAHYIIRPGLIYKKRFRRR